MSNRFNNPDVCLVRNDAGDIIVFQAGGFQSSVGSGEPQSRCRSIYVNPKGTPWSITSADKPCVRISSESFSPVQLRHRRRVSHEEPMDESLLKHRGRSSEARLSLALSASGMILESRLL